MALSIDPNALVSPTQSPTLSPTQARRLSARRGSVSAADPWNQNSAVNSNPARALSSRLTIVRVSPTELEEPTGPGRKHRRHGSNASIGSTSSTKTDGGRMSFAFSSFTPSNPSAMSGGRPVSPSASPRLRPSSPHRYSGSFVSQSKLSPEQLVDLARTSCNPRPQAPSSSTNAPSTSPEATPVSFTPLPDSIYLPFIDRPGEVTQLISQPPTSKLFALLQQTFPADSRAPLGSANAKRTESSDPRQWTYADLEHWLKNVDRDVADDVLWVEKARRCIFTHSELLWERIKGALGVPLELDFDEEEEAQTTVGHAEPLHSDAAQVIVPDADLLNDESAVADSPLEAYPYSVGEEPDCAIDEISIEPVLATSAPPPPTAEPGIGSALQEVREEDEEEGGDAEPKQLDGQVHGLRFSMSPTAAGQPVRSPSMNASGSVQASPTFSMRRMSLHDDSDSVYDVARERGPGHPLFPSSFANLALGPTLKANSRSKSMAYPPPPAFPSPHAIRAGVRAGSMSAGAGKPGRLLRPDWAQHFDPAKHEYAVTTGSSVSGYE